MQASPGGRAASPRTHLPLHIRRRPHRRRPRHHRPRLPARLHRRHRLPHPHGFRMAVILGGVPSRATPHLLVWSAATESTPGPASAHVRRLERTKVEHRSGALPLENYMQMDMVIGQMRLSRWRRSRGQHLAGFRISGGSLNAYLLYLHTTVCMSFEILSSVVFE